MRRKFSAFTLVELLLAMAITSVLVVLLGSVVTASLNVWQQGRNRLDTFANARFILNRISDELAGVAAQAGRVQFIENTPLYTNPAPVAEKSENIFFVASYPNDKAGDLCVIAYRHDPATFHLDRAFRDSEAAASPPPGNRYRVTGYDFASADWRTIANGVLEFEIQSYSQADFDATPRPTVTPTPSWDSEIAGGKSPRHVILRLKIVDDKTAVALGALPPGAAYDRLVNEKAREFKTDVTLPSR